MVCNGEKRLKRENYAISPTHGIFYNIQHIILLIIWKRKSLNQQLFPLTNGGAPSLLLMVHEFHYVFYSINLVVQAIVMDAETCHGRIYGARHVQHAGSTSLLLYLRIPVKSVSLGRRILSCSRIGKPSKALFGCKVPNSKKNFRHLHGDLNLNEIKNALRLLSVNGETNLMNLIGCNQTLNCYSNTTVNNL